jgi:two-component system, NtrC family, sensor kinase
MRVQLIIVFLITFASFIGVLVWRVDETMFADKMSWSEAQSRSQMSPLVHSLEIEFSNLSDTLELSMAALRDSKKDFAKSSPLGRFQMVAILKSQGPKDWNIEKTVFLERSSTKTWAQQYLSLLLKNIDGRDIKPGGFSALSLLDPQRRPYIFILHNLALASDSDETSTPAWYGVLAGPEFFQSMMDRQKGQLSSVYLVNQLGQALGHTTPEYVGNLLSEDPIVAELMATQAGNGSGIFKNLTGDTVQGFYEQVAKSNVYAVITTPVNALLKNRDQVRLQILMMGLGLAFLGVAVFVLVYKPEKQIVKMASTPAVPTGPKTVVTSAVSPAAVSPATSAPVKNTSGELQAEKMQIFLRMASALSHEIKGPLSAILGHAQLLRSSPGNEEHIGAIEDHARKSRELLQKLRIFTGEDSPKIENIKLTDLVRKALRHVEAQIFRKGVQLNIQELMDVKAIALPADLVCKAIENILLNSIEAMERAAKKELKISLRENQGVFELKITDTGEGIESQNLAKIFDPFFTTKSSQHQVGLGLSMSLGILKEIGGQLAVESERGKGTTVSISIDPSAVAAAPSAGSIAPAAPKPPPPVPPLPEKAKAPAMMILDDQDVEDVLGMEDLAEAAPAEPAAAVATPPTPPQPQASSTSLDSPPLPKAKSAESAVKIDKPKINMPARSSKLDQVSFQIRKPSERNTDRAGDKT